MPAAGAVLNAGGGQTLSVRFTPDDTSDFVPATATISINVHPAPLTITAVDAVKVYGQPNPSFAARYAGFVLGQDPSVLDGSLTFTTSATKGSQPGHYVIDVSGVASSNYSISFQSGILTVLPRASKTMAGPQAFVTVLYREMLDREPEIAGLDYWTNEIARGLKPRVVTRLFWHSKERQILVRQHDAPKITIRKALADGLRAWSTVATSKPAWPKGPLVLRQSNRVTVR
jgi:hypothetical protein